MDVINPKTPSTTPGSTEQAPVTSSFMGTMSERNDPRRYISVVLSHWWLVLLVLLLGTAVGAAYCILATTQYRAICRYEIYMDERLRFSAGQFAQGGDMAYGRQRSRQVLLLTGANLRSQVYAKLTPKWNGVISDLVTAVAVRPVREVETMMDISVDGVSGEYALDFLKELLNEYQEVQRTLSLEANENALRSLWVEKQRLAADLDEAQNALLKFQKEHNIRFTEAKQEFEAKFLENLIERQNTLRMERTMLMTQFPFLQQANTATIQDVLQLTMETHAATTGNTMGGGNLGGGTGSGAGGGTGTDDGGNTGGKGSQKMSASAMSDAMGWQMQEEMVARAEAEYQDLLAVYKPSHPKMRELQRMIDASKRNLRFGADTALKRLKSRYEALNIQGDALDDAAKKWKGDITMSVADRATYDSMKSKVDHLKQLHDQVYTRILDGAAQNIDAVFNHMVEPPRIVGIVWPSRVKIMSVSIVVALILGVAFSFILDFLDTAMMDVMALEEKLGLQYLSSIPNWDRLVQNLDRKNAQVVVRKDKSSITSEVYRSLRTSLENMIQNKIGFALCVCSTDANEGKSLTTINLAATFGWTGRKVLLVDGDLRRGKLHSTFGVEAKMGITDFLLGKVTDWHQIVFPTSYENLFLIPVGAYNHSAPELLDPVRMKKLVEEWGKEYDLIIFDTAPVGRVVDAALIARACDGVLLVTRSGHVTLAGVRHALHRLEGVRILGFCINGIEVTGRHLGYLNYYGYFRKFGRYGHYSYYNYYDRYRYGQYGYGHEDSKDPKNKSDGSTPPAAST